jgi:hypothetical protein
MHLQFDAMQPLGPGLVLLLMLLVFIWAAYQKVRTATDRADAGSNKARARLHQKQGR